LSNDNAGPTWPHSIKTFYFLQDGITFTRYKDNAEWRRLSDEQLHQANQAYERLTQGGLTTQPAKTRPFGIGVTVHIVDNLIIGPDVLMFSLARHEPSLLFLGALGAPTTADDLRSLAERYPEMEFAIDLGPNANADTVYRAIELFEDPKRATPRTLYLKTPMEIGLCPSDS
jgi:hypothetical protein